jgi:hypothetical protein
MATRSFRLIKLVRGGRTAANSTTAPPDMLAPGELAIGENGDRLYYGRADGAIAVLNDDRSTFNVASQVAMLALSARMGDLAIRSDEKITYVLQGQNPTVLDNWEPIATLVSVLGDLADVDGTIPTDTSALVYNPSTQLWSPSAITQLTDGGAF